jgi:hypothetical protein
MVNRQSKSGSGKNARPKRLKRLTDSGVAKD